MMISGFYFIERGFIMKRFKSIVLPMQGKSKTNLIWLYNTKFDPTEMEDEPAKIYSYNNFKFWFSGTSHRNSEKLMLFVEIPKNLININFTNSLPVETYLLKYLSTIINGLSRKHTNTAKNVREKAQFQSQNVNGVFLKRSGLLYNEHNEGFIFKIMFNVPLLNALSINAKATIRAIKDILDNIETSINAIDLKKCQNYIDTYLKQETIRKYLSENNLCSFVGDGSILPRENNTIYPKIKAIPFKSPESLQININFQDGSTITGMAIKQGVTIVTGGGYSGKTTLLDAIEMGIYNHIPKDGREFVITDNTALKIYAEDGRPINNIDISPLFNFIPNHNNSHDFSTTHASGSVSQAANIIEGVLGESNLLLIDEDRSATNFMIRDINMRKVVPNEPIIPFTDRVRELYEEKDVSTILVIGGSSEYLKYADTVILINEFHAKDITSEIKNEFYQCNSNIEKAIWSEERYLLPINTTETFINIKSIVNENQKKIILDDYNADISFLTALITDYQIHSLALIIEKLLMKRDINQFNLIDDIKKILDNIFKSDKIEDLLLKNYWYENVRPIDIFCSVNRIRGLSFYTNKDI